MLYLKITHGHVEQFFNDAGEFIKQQFVPNDDADVEYETEDEASGMSSGDGINVMDMPLAGREQHPFDMVQEAVFGDDIENDKSTFSDVGVELSDGGYIAFPEVDCEGTIRRRDSNGNCEEVRRVGDTDYDEWRDLFPDDQLYFQPEGAGNRDAGTASKINSHQVYRHLENATKEHPDCEIEAFTGDDIEKPKFLDVDKPVFGHPNNQ